VLVFNSQYFAHIVVHNRHRLPGRFDDLHKFLQVRYCLFNNTVGTCLCLMHATFVRGSNVAGAKDDMVSLILDGSPI
jgi:hypothetical protein